MQLKRLEAYGFKSFADKVTLDFESGITAIVGPNGSGKSNITDAIRWVLGEQSMRNLRGSKAEDIIFTGSEKRRALGIAEVSLIFDNEDGTLAADFREVAVTRRLYRSGESEYFINHAKCRLKDIYNLFADTGIGHDGMSIIGQNRIDDILNSRPEERRAFFEETAGITKYRNRKRETVRKIEETENNLVRVEDIIREIGKQLEPLARHAEKTRRYNELAESYKEARLTALSHSYAEAAEKKAENDEARRSAGDRALGAEIEVRTLEAQKAETDKAIVDLENERKAQAAENEAIRGRLEKANEEQARLVERQRQNGAARERIAQRREELAGRITAAEAEIRRLTDESVGKEEEQKTLGAAIGKDREKRDKLDASDREMEEALSALRETLRQKEQQLAEKRQRIAVIEHDIETGEEGQSSRTAEKEAQEAKLEKLRKLAANLTHDAEAAESTREKEKARLHDLREKHREAEAAVRKAEGEVRAYAGTKSQAKSKLDFLARMQSAYEGFGRAAKAVLRSHEPWRQGISGAIAELIHVDKDYVPAIEVVLGGNMQNIVIQDTDTAKAAIAFLKRERLGRVTFLPLSTLVVRESPSLSYGRADGVIGWASALAHADGIYQKAIDFLLSRTLVVDTLDHALVLAKKLGYRQRIVTLGGELLNPGGSLSGGSRQRKEASYLDRSGEMESLKDEIAKAQQMGSRAAEMAGKAQKESARLEALERESSEAVGRYDVRVAELRTDSARLQENIKEQEVSLAEMEAASLHFATSFAETQKERNHLSREVKAVEADCKKMEADCATRAAVLEDARQDADDLKAVLQEKELRHAVIVQEIMRAKEGIAIHEAEKARSGAALDGLDREEGELAAFMTASEDELRRIGKEAEAAGTGLAEGREAYDAIDKRRMDSLAARDKLEQAVKKASQTLGHLQAEIHQIEIAGAKLDIALEEDAQTILSKYGLTPERAAEMAQDIDGETLRQRMKSLEREMADLGPVNPNAVEEYEKLQERHTFMQKQSDDLVGAKANLETILSEMDAAMTKQFKEAFQKIQEYFADIFVRLFGGGKAELRLLDEDDVLDTGVEILVTLPRKKRQNISALSGGERALTVIALLFAFLKYRPSPFAVLDEIDAPLDEANVVRFGRFLKEFSDSTQFIVVTHRKGTMEVTDTMYGVTIEDAGVSRVLSVKMEDAAEGA